MRLLWQGEVPWRGRYRGSIPGQPRRAARVGERPSSARIICAAAAAVYEADSAWREQRAMGRDVVKWVGRLLAVVGVAAFVYGLITLISNGNCGCSDDGFCSGPPCPPADDLGFLGLFAGIWVAIGGIIMMSVAASRAKVAQWRAQFASGTAAYAG